MIWKFLRKLKKYRKLSLELKDKKKYVYKVVYNLECVFVYLYSKYRYIKFNTRKFCDENGSFCDKVLLIVFLIGSLFFFIKLIKIIL